MFIEELIIKVFFRDVAAGLANSIQDQLAAMNYVKAVENMDKRSWG